MRNIQFDFMGGMITGESKQSDANKRTAEGHVSLYQNVSRSVAYGKWKEHEQKACDFALNDQLTEDEIDALQAAGMPTFTVNRVTENVRRMRFFLTARPPRFLFAGREGSDVDLATVLSRHVEYCWDKSDADMHMSLALNDAITRSIGYVVVEVDPYADRGMGEVRIAHADPWEIYPDPASRDMLFRDASFVMIKQDRTKGQLIGKLPQFKKVILEATGKDEHTASSSQRNTAISESIQPMDIDELLTGEEERTIIDYYQVYKKIKLPYVGLTIRTEPSKAELQSINKRVESEVAMMQEKLERQLEDHAIGIKDALEKGEISKERGEFEVKKAQEDAQASLQQYRTELMTREIEAVTTVESIAVKKEEAEKLIKSKLYKDRIVSALDYWEDAVQVTASVGSSFLYRYILPIQDYPIIPIPYLWTGTPYPISLVRLVVGKQQEINKAHQLMIHNVSLGSSLRYKFKTGAVDWEGQASKAVTMPGGGIEILGNMEDFQELLPAPLPTTFLALVEKGERDLDDAMGVAALSRADAIGERTPYKGLEKYDEMSTRDVRSWLSSVVEKSLKQIGKVFLQLAPHVYTTYRSFMIVEPNGSKAEEYQINVPLYDSLGKEIGRMRDYRSLQYDVKVASGSTLPYDRQSELLLLMQAFRDGLVDDIAVMEKMDIPNKERIIARKSLIAQAQQRIEQMDKEIKDQSGTIETLKRQIVQSEIKDSSRVVSTEMTRAAAQAKSEMDTAVAEFRKKSELLIEKAALELGITIKEKKASSNNNAKTEKKP